MRSLWLGILTCAAMLVACGDDDSDFAPRPSDDSSSSVCKDCDDGSSSSAKSSSSPVKSSSSIKSSSSSAKSSSSSVTLAIPCKTDSTDTCEYGELVDDRDGQTYKTVKIGDQWWMAENLNYAYLQPTDELDSSSFCYNDSAEYCEKYGRLYLWSAAMDSAGTWSSNGKGCGYDVACSPTYPVRGVCPEGWLLPTQTEWNTLFTAVGGQSTAGKMLRSTNGWYSSGNGTDAYSFSALPAGNRNYYGNYYGEGHNAYFWSSTEYGSYYAYYMSLNYDGDDARPGSNYKYYGFSVRCVKDDGETAVSSSSKKDESSSSSTPKSSSSETSVSSSSIKSSSSKVPEPEGGVLTDSRDGQTYKTVSIGMQTWMAENLNYEINNSYCYNDNASNCTKYGRLYTWAAAMDSVGTWSANGKGCGYGKTCSPKFPVRGVCPEGWHLPTQTEWNTLFTAVGGQSTAGKMLKSTSGWNGSGNGTDAYSFSALPAGGRYDDGNFYGEGSSAYFWGSSEYDSDYAFRMYLYYGRGLADLDSRDKDYGFSVRCVKD